MGFLQFPNKLRVKPIGTDEVMPCAGFQFPSHGELGYVRAQLYIRGTLAGTEKLRMKVFSDAAYAKLMYVGEWADLSKVEGREPGKDWIGWITFAFGREHLNKNTTYYMAVEAAGYERLGDSFYLGLVLDWPISVNLSAAEPRRPVALAFFPYMELNRP